MKMLDIRKDGRRIDRVLEYDATLDERRRREVERIVEAVRRRGDRAVAEFTHKFDGVKLAPREFQLPLATLRAAWEQLPLAQKKTLQTSARRIREFHQRQLRKSWEFRDADGVRLMQRCVPLDAVGLYVPGGAAAYPSTVLMCAIPAQAAGVRRIVMVTPPSRAGRLNAATLAAAHLAGVTEVFQIGGAQAVAALAFGTRSIGRVDKVVGPGNVFVALAKRLLYGRIGIDSIAGPSEILVLCDAGANPAWVAADLLSQAEHDADAIALCVVIGGREPAAAIAAEVRRQTAQAPRREIIAQALKRHGAIIRVDTPDQAVELVNRRAPEHLEILARSPRSIAARITNAGAVFLGPWTPEAFGDYTAGSNHVLPTGGTARFFSPLSVDDYVKRINWVECSRPSLEKLGPATIAFAELEGLDAHAQAVRLRLNPPKK